MRIKIGAFLLALSLPAYAGDVVDRAQIPVRVASTGKYVGVLAAPKLLFQILPIGGGGGGSSGGAAGPFTSVTVGTTTTAGTAICVIDDTMGGASTTDNFVNCTGTWPAALTVATNFFGFYIHLTGNGSTASIRQADLAVVREPGYTGGSVTSAAIFENATYGSGTVAYGASATASFGAQASVNSVYGPASGNPAVGVGFKGYSNGGTTSRFGVIGEITGSGAIPGVGVSGNIVTGASTDYGSGWFTLDGVAKPAAAFSLGATNGTAAVPICNFYDNTTLKISCLDGGNFQIGNNQLTAATMTAENNAIVGNAVFSGTWTNAQVVALGAGTTGDITVATLPAKTVVRNAYVVITGAAVGPATVTVSCGDAIAGTPFINYVVPSDAKAAANTVYGDAVAERGTSIDVEFYYMPSYTATTLVTCHFIASGANLNTVTGSTGRVILETVTLP